MKYYLVRFSRKTGKIDTTLEHDFSSAMLTMWGLQKTTKTKDTIVFDSEGRVISYIEGTEDFPKVYRDTNEHIDKYCPGLLDALNKDTKV